MIGDILSTIFLRQNRSIAGIVPDVAVEEVHRDELAVTDQPVEQGAAITDHAFKRPAEVSVRYGWSDSGGLLKALLSPSAPSVDEVYQKLLTLQESRQPFDLITGRRAYKNMLIGSLQVTTDARTNQSLMVSASMRQIIIVQVTTVQMPPKTAQAFPVDTAPPTNAGVKQPAPANESILFKGGSIAGALGL